MRLVTLAGAGLLAVALSAGGAFAQNTRPDIALSTSPYGSMSCAKFLGMGPGSRDAIVRKMIAMAPASSLSQTDIGTSVGPDGVFVQEPDNTTIPPLDSRQLASACQATTGAATLRDAYARTFVDPQLEVETN